MKNKSDIIFVVIAIATVILLLFALIGCVGTDRDAKATAVTTRQMHEVGTEAGQPYERRVVEQTATNSDSHSSSTTGLDATATTALTSIGGQLASGNWLGAIGGAVGVAVPALVAVLSERKRANEHKADAAEGWAKAEQAMKDNG